MSNSPGHQPPLYDATFDVVAAFPPGTAAFRIISDTQVLAQLPVPAHSPVVSVTSPLNGAAVTDVLTATWTATDADGAPLYFNVEYNNSGNDASWLPLAAGITGTQWVGAAGALGGSAGQSRVRVSATDGVNTTVAQSGLFSVPLKAPEPFIENPPAGAHYAFGQPLALDGAAFDAQDIEVTGDSSLVWSSSLVPGTLGTGHLLNLNGLPVGMETITFAATNSLSLTASTTMTITIDGSSLFLPLTRR